MGKGFVTLEDLEDEHDENIERLEREREDLKRRLANNKLELNRAKSDKIITHAKRMGIIS